jgi:hypothetical protein
MHRQSRFIPPFHPGVQGWCGWASQILEEASFWFRILRKQLLSWALEEDGSADIKHLDPKAVYCLRSDAASDPWAHLHEEGRAHFKQEVAAFMNTKWYNTSKSRPTATSRAWRPVVQFANFYSDGLVRLIILPGLVS